MPDERSSRSIARAETNRNIRMAVKRFDLTDLEQETWDFLCECGDENCERWITLTLLEYEALRQKDEPILAPGHSMVLEDVEALGVQAHVQKKRAARNVRKDDDG